MTWVQFSAFSFSPRPSAFLRGCFPLLLFCLLLSDLASAQRRPVLSRPRHDHVAGKVVLIPPDSRPVSFQLPRLVAHIADHELIAPPRSSLGDRARAADVERLVAWAREVDYANADGVIVSLDMLAYGGAPSSRTTTADAKTVEQRWELLTWIRAQRPRVAIYGFTASETINQMALDLVAAGALDYLIINQDDQALPAATREQLLAEVQARKLTDQVWVRPTTNDTVQILLARLLNHRFGIAPRVLSLSSSAIAPIPPSVNAQIQAIGGRRVPIASEAARQADILLFAHTPQTDETRLLSFADEISRAAEAGYRVAVVDASEDKASRDRLMAELRRRKLLDRLMAYAVCDPDAIGTVLAQASARLITAKFLRDDPDRLQRAERAQIETLLHHYLAGWAYTDLVRPKLEAFVREQLQADPDHLGAAVERAEEFARGELKPLAEEIFAEQFRRNVHAILLSTGERIEFEVRALQRFQFYLPWQQTVEAEIKPNVYLPLLGTKPSAAKTVWELITPKNLDERIFDRLDRTDWTAFDAGAELVEIGFNINQQSSEATEDYAIRSRKRSKEVRRIEITASSPRGAFYALGRLELLGAEGKLNQDFQLTETPSFKQRGIVESFSLPSWSHRDRLDVLRFMGRLRMNRYYYAPAGDPSNDERRESPPVQEQFKELLQTARENFVDLVYAIRPGPSISYSSEEDFTALARQLDATAALGVRHFALFFDDAPERLPKEEDRTRFPTPAAAHAHFANRAYEHLRRAAPGSSLTVKPAIYDKPSGHGDYLKELGSSLPKEIAIFWAGSDVSTEHTEAQAPPRGELTGRPVLIWDDFLANDAKPWRLSLGAKRGASSTWPEQAIGFIARPMNQAHASMLPLATVADYAWDARGYDPERALSRALNLLYDERSRAGLRVWERASREEPFQLLFQPQRGEVNMPLMEQRLAEMQAALEAVGTTRERGLLRGELASFVARIRAALERLKK